MNDRYATKSEIDEAYGEFRVFIHHLESLRFATLDLKQSPPKPFGDRAELASHLTQQFVAIHSRVAALDHARGPLANNSIFARAELPAFEWDGSPCSGVAVAALEAAGQILAWLLRSSATLRAEGAELRSLEDDRREIEAAFPVSEGEMPTLWGRWELEWSRLQRDLPAIAAMQPQPQMEFPRIADETAQPIAAQAVAAEKPQGGAKRSKRKEPTAEELVQRFIVNFPTKVLTISKRKLADAIGRSSSGVAETEAWKTIRRLQESNRQSYGDRYSDIEPDIEHDFD